jgi:ketosteroid isomerase-like protein
MRRDVDAAIRRLFRAIDARDTQVFLSFLGDDVVFRFGNAAPIAGKPAVGEAVAAFFASIAALSHDVQEIWDTGDAVICHGQVGYTRHDGTQLSVPFANIFRMSGDSIGEYLIFADNSQLYRTA